MRMRAEGHQRLIEPLNALGYTCIAMMFLLTGAFSRREQTGRIVTAILAVVALQAAALGAAYLAGKDALFTPLMYVVALLPIAIGLYIIIEPGRRFPDQRALPIGASTT